MGIVSSSWALRLESIHEFAEKRHLSLAVVRLVDILKSPLVVGSSVEAELGHHRATVGSVVVDVGGGQALTSDTGHVPLLDVVSLHRQMCIMSITRNQISVYQVIGTLYVTS